MSEWAKAMDHAVAQWAKAEGKRFLENSKKLRAIRFAGKTIEDLQLMVMAAEGRAFTAEKELAICNEKRLKANRTIRRLRAKQ